jgi:hypothetical protein
MINKTIIRNIWLGSIIILVFVTACTSGSQTDTVGKDNQQGSLPLTANNKDFSAEVNTKNQIVLSWTPISGVDEYLIELQIGGDEYIPLASLSADKTTFIDEKVPADTDLTYRLNGISKTKTTQSKLVMVATPVKKTNPLKITVAFDQTPASIDPKNLDPNKLDLSKIDPNNFDPTMFMPQSLQTTQVVGPKGGELTVTGTNNVVYKLIIPAESLNFEVSITLKPISSIPDLPLSKGLIGAVFIEPQEMVFRIPATLTITSSDKTSTPPGSLKAAFAFETNGQEFHLFPTEDNVQANLGAHTARLITQPLPDEKPKDELKITSGGGYGKGNGTPAEINDIVASNPTNAVDGTIQEVAAAQLEELETLPNLPKEVGSLAKTGEKISQSAKKADNMSKFMESLDEFTSYTNSDGGKYNKGLNEKIIATLVEKANSLLQKNKNDCLSEEDIKAQELLERLVKPKNDFEKLFSRQFINKFGESLINDLYNGLKACSYQIQMKSNLSYDVEDSVLFTSMETQKIPLNFVYVKGEVFLWGSGPMKLNSSVSGTCSFPLQHYDNLTLSIQKLSPIFDKGKLIDFAMKQIFIIGWIPGPVGISTGGDNCPTMVKLSGGGDYWTGMFTMARATLKNELMMGWKLQQGDSSKGAPLKANWQSVNRSFTPMGVAGTMSEDTKLELVITPNKKK